MRKPRLRGTARAFLLLAVLVIATASGLPAVASDEHLPGSFPPPGPDKTIYTFRGNEDDWNGTHWGGWGGAEGHCEGIVRDVLGLLSARGEPLPVPEAQQITSGGVVVGFTNAAGTGRGYNLDMTTFAEAWSQLDGTNYDKLYNCGHGNSTTEVEGKGGLIVLDDGFYFDGFGSGNRPFGSNVNARPPYDPLGAPGGNVEITLHTCVSGQDPDGAGTQHFSVHDTLEQVAPSVVDVVHSHMGNATARTLGGLDILDPNVSINETLGRQLLDAMAQGLGRLRFPERYPAAQALLDEVFEPDGIIVAHLFYEDTGERPDPPGEVLGTLCPSAGPFGCFRTKLKRSVATGFDDALDTGEAVGKGAKEICAPVRELANPSQDSRGTHLVGYKVKGPHARREGIYVVDAVGTTPVDTKKTATLFVPGEVALAGERSPRYNRGAAQAAYRCVKAKAADKTLAKGRRFTLVAGIFAGSPITVELKKLDRVCVATAPDGEVNPERGGVLQCYKAKAVDKTTLEGFQIADRFGTATVGLKQMSTVCFPGDLGDTTAPLCGNSVVEVGETCDDGNAVSQDGCSDRCIEERCGDGILQAGLGEVCDGGDFGLLGAPTLGFCSSDCQDRCDNFSKFKFYSGDVGATGHRCVDACGTSNGLFILGICLGQSTNLDCRIDDGTSIDWFDAEMSGFGTTSITGGFGCVQSPLVNTDRLLDETQENCFMRLRAPAATTHCTTGTCSPSCVPLGAACLRVDHEPDGTTFGLSEEPTGCGARSAHRTHAARPARAARR